MAKYPAADLRNVVLIGHGDAGKTTLAEHLLFKMGATSRLGSVKEKSSIVRLRARREGARPLDRLRRRAWHVEGEGDQPDRLSRLSGLLRRGRHRRLGRRPGARLRQRQRGHPGRHPARMDGCRGPRAARARSWSRSATSSIRASWRPSCEDVRAAFGDRCLPLPRRRRSSAISSRRGPTPRSNRTTRS